MVPLPKENNKRRRVRAGRVVVAIALFLSGSGLWRCSADDENYFQEETLTESISLGQMEAYDALEVDYLVEVQFFLNNTVSLTNPDLNLTFTNDTTKKIITLDFGPDSKYSTYFNRIRSGKILISYPTFAGDSVARRTLTFDNFFVSKRKIEGQIDLDSITGDTIQLRSRCRFTDFKVTFPDGSGALYNGTQNRLWSSGENDFTPTNNSYVITNLSATLMGSTLDGRTFTSSLQSPALLNYYCALSGNYAGVNGTVIIPALSGFADRTREVKFGSVCDNQVTVTTWRRTFSINVN